MNRKRFFLVSLMVVFVLTVNASAIEIVKGFIKPKALIMAFTENGKPSSKPQLREMTEVLRFDMDNSGYFRVHSTSPCATPGPS